MFGFIAKRKQETWRSVIISQNMPSRYDGEDTGGSNCQQIMIKVVVDSAATAIEAERWRCRLKGYGVVVTMDIMNTFNSVKWLTTEKNEHSTLPEKRSVELVYRQGGKIEELESLRGRYCDYSCGISGIMESSACIYQRE